LQAQEENGLMGDDQIIKLLEEIRDLHKLHIGKYEVAVRNQQEAIDMQRSSVRRTKIIQLVFVLLLAGLVGLLALGYR
jgi:hypothetical protein